jgi:hypothetical protein
MSVSTVLHSSRNFILGTAAEFECIWSICDNVLKDQRKGITSQLFEALAFLRCNKRFWKQMLVSQAMAMASAEMSRMQAELDAAQLEYDDDEN